MSSMRWTFGKRALRESIMSSIMSKIDDQLGE
jgi:hypothetical protein